MNTLLSLNFSEESTGVKSDDDTPRDKKGRFQYHAAREKRLVKFWKAKYEEAEKRIEIAVEIERRKNEQITKAFIVLQRSLLSEEKNTYRPVVVREDRPEKYH